MLISTKGRYALYVMIDLAEHHSEKYIPLETIAARQEISKKYLESILTAFVRAGLLSGIRGKKGGYRLNRAPDQYTVLEILLLAEGRDFLSATPKRAKDEAAFHTAAHRQVYQLESEFDRQIETYFSSVTLDRLLEQEGGAFDYYVI